MGKHTMGTLTLSTLTNSCEFVSRLFVKYILLVKLTCSKLPHLYRNGTVAPIDSAPYKDFQLSPKGWAIVLGCVVIFWILLSILLACFCANTKQGMYIT